MITEVMWFRRDLRVTDHDALTSGADADRLLCVFVLDQAVLDRAAPARLRYLRQALGDLHDALAERGNGLVVLEGDPATEVPRAAAAVGAARVRITTDHTPYATNRDDAVGDALSGTDVELVRHDGVAIVPPGTVRTGSGTVYKVFTPFHRKWRDDADGDPLAAPDGLPAIPSDHGLDAVAIDDLGVLDVNGPPVAWPDGGESAARKRLDRWLAEGVDGYDETRNDLHGHGTSRLSPDLHFGCLSPREVHSRLDLRRTAHTTFASELAWRDFYLHVMAEWPEAATEAFRPELRGMRWRDDPQGFEAWADGQTGFPVIDAAMRQLRTTGWMPNRARMIVASFLCKDLLVDWRQGEAHFMRHLVDGDVASNNGGWQWAAGTGTDAQPFFRIFNPTSQAKKFDPDGDYVRAHVSELREVPTKWIHEPWTMPEAAQAEAGVVIGEDYPAPLVDHAEARERALEWWDARP